MCSPRTWRRARRQAWRSRKVERQARHQVMPDPGLLDLGKKWVRRRAARVVMHQLMKILELAPQHPGPGEGLPDLVEAMAGAPSAEQGGDHVARLVAPGLGVQIDLHHRTDHCQPLGQPGRLAQMHAIAAGSVR